MSVSLYLNNYIRKMREAFLMSSKKVFPEGLRQIESEIDYIGFVGITYECGVVIPIYINHFGTVNLK